MSNIKETSVPSSTTSCGSEKKYKKYSRIFPETDGDDIVISGISGKFPNCHNVAEYEYNLYNKVRLCNIEN